MRWILCIFKEKMMTANGGCVFFHYLQCQTPSFYFLKWSPQLRPHSSVFAAAILIHILLRSSSNPRRPTKIFVLKIIRFFHLRENMIMKIRSTTELKQLFVTRKAQLFQYLIIVYFMLHWVWIPSSVNLLYILYISIWVCV